MKSNKLLSVLRSLSPKERRGFDAWVCSGIFKFGSSTLHFWRCLFDLAPSFDVDKMTHQKFGAMEGEASVSTQNKHLYLSYLWKAMESYLVFLQQRKYADTKNHLLLAELRERNLISVYEKSRKAISRKRNDEPEHHENWHLIDYLIAAEDDRFFLQHQNRKAHQALQNMGDSLDLHFISARLRTTCQMLNRSNIIQSDFDFGLTKLLTDWLFEHSDRYASEPSITIYLAVYGTLVEADDEKHYQRLVALLAEYHTLFPEGEVHDLYRYAQNYCIGKINRGSERFLQEIFDLYRFQLEQDLIREGEFLNQYDYKNIATTALRLNEFEWTYTFLQDWRQHLDPKHRNNVFQYNLASWYYESKAYGDALRTLQLVNYTDVYYHLSAKSLQLKIFYEQQDSIALEQLVDTFRVYLHRNRTVSEYQRTVHLNLLRLAQRCDRLRAEVKRSAEWLVSFQKLKEDAANLPVNNRSWLLRCINLLAGAK